MKRHRRVCKCFFCVRYRRIEKTKKHGDIAALRALVDELHGSLCETEEDLNYKEAILDGSWPQAEEILTRSLELAREKKRKIV